MIHARLINSERIYALRKNYIPQFHYCTSHEPISNTTTQYDPKQCPDIPIHNLIYQQVVALHRIVAQMRERHSRVIHRE